jgi:hypothetical protein
MKKWFKKLKPKRTTIEERANILEEEKDKHKTYNSTSPQSSSDSSNSQLIDEDVEDIPPNFILTEVESHMLKRIRADMKEPPTRLTFKEKVRNFFTQRSSSKDKAQRIRKIAFKERLTNLIPRRLRPKDKTQDNDIEGKGRQQIGREDEDINTQASRKFPIFQTFPTFPSYPESPYHQRPADKDMFM